MAGSGFYKSVDETKFSEAEKKAGIPLQNSMDGVKRDILKSIADAKKYQDLAFHGIVEMLNDSAQLPALSKLTEAYVLAQENIPYGPYALETMTRNFQELNQLAQSIKLNSDLKVMAEPAKGHREAIAELKHFIQAQLTKLENIPVTEAEIKFHPFTQQWSQAVDAFSQKLKETKKLGFSDEPPLLGYSSWGISLHAKWKTKIEALENFYQHKVIPLLKTIKIMYSDFPDKTKRILDNKIRTLTAQALDFKLKYINENKHLHPDLQQRFNFIYKSLLDFDPQKLEASIKRGNSLKA